MGHCPAPQYTRPLRRNLDGADNFCMRFQAGMNEQDLYNAI